MNPASDCIDCSPVPLRNRESHLWQREDNDWYVEPEWVSEMLFAVEQFDGRIWDPACGMGRIPIAAEAAGYIAVGSDIVNRGWNETRVGDFLTSQEQRYKDKNTFANIVCNPPFKMAEEFVKHALRMAERKVAMLLPSTWLQGDRRSRWLETTPLLRVWFITPRPSMPPGAVIQSGQNPGGGTVDFAWFIWVRGCTGARPEIRWLRREEGRA